MGFDRARIVRSSGSADLASRPSQGRITVGISELCDAEDFVDLSRRADSALIAARLEQRSRSG
jgi:PleD family two-component response regulator